MQIFNVLAACLAIPDVFALNEQSGYLLYCEFAVQIGKDPISRSRARFYLLKLPARAEGST